MPNNPTTELFPAPSGNPQAPAPPNKKPDPFIAKVMQSVNDLSTALKVLEDRYSLLRKKTQITDQNLLDAERNIVKETKLLSEDVLGMKKEVHDLVEEAQSMQAELQKSVTRHDFTALQRYVEYWEPMGFVTRKEFEEWKTAHEPKYTPKKQTLKNSSNKT